MTCGRSSHRMILSGLIETRNTRGEVGKNFFTHPPIDDKKKTSQLSPCRLVFVLLPVWGFPLELLPQIEKNYPLFLKIVGNVMTGAAYLILIMNALTVRQSVALLTRRDQSMLRMTLGTGQGRMLGLLDRQLLVRIGMAATADLFVLVNGIGDLQRRMDGMASQAVGSGQLNSRTV